MTWLILLINFILRLIFAFYGYIATEEGILLYNQRLAYSGQLPFINYDSWSSLFHDYLLGWHQFIFGTSILTQRLVGIALAVLIFKLTLKLAHKLEPRSTPLVALLTTLASPLYLYFSTIPYSEQFMTLFIMLALFWLASLRPQLAFLSAIAAGLIRSQALPITFIIWTYLFFTQSRRRFIKLTLAGIALTLILLSPFLLKSPVHVLWAIFWPLQASKALIYQQSFQGLNLSYLANFFLELTRDYGLLFAVILAGLFTAKRRLLVLPLLIIASQLAVAFIHQPPYASYLYPFVPLLAVWAGFYLSRTPKFTRALIILILLTNFILFPHAQFIKTSLATVKSTPHTYLDQISADLEELTPPNSQVLAFYTPPVIEAGRRLPKNLNRDRFSLSPLPSPTTDKFHLTNLVQLQDLISQHQFSAIILTSRSSRVLDRSTLDIIEEYYILTKTYTEIRLIEDPRTGFLYLYLPRPKTN